MRTVPREMTTRGDLLALVAGAPGPLGTLQGALTTWMHLERAAAAVARAEADPADAAALADAASEVDVGDVVDLRAGFDALDDLDDLTVLKELEEEMQEAVSKLEFERAALIRDQINALRKKLEMPQLKSPGKGGAKRKKVKY